MRNKFYNQCIFVLFTMAMVQIAYSQTSCDDLSAVPEIAAIDYDSQIQTIFDTRCTNCHTNGGAFGGLSLESGVSRGNLVGITANSSALERVSPGNTALSFLFHKLNCNDPAGGSRMPNGGPFLSATTQGLVRDWINQGANATPPSNNDPVAVSDSGNTAFGYTIDFTPLDNDTDSDGNGLVITGIGQGENGRATLVGDRVIYTPDIGFSGTDNVPYSISDGNGGSATSSISISVDPAIFLMNFGLSGSWYNLFTNGQGFIIEVIPEQEVVLVYWFTFDAQGSGAQQWLIGFGDIMGNTADIEFFRPIGGILDDPTEVSSPSYATGRIIFDDCLNGYFYYDSEQDMVAGEFEFTRLSPDAQCQMEVDAAMGM